MRAVGPAGLLGGLVDEARRATRETPGRRAAIRRRAPTRSRSPSARRRGLERHGVARELLHEQALDREQEIIDPVDGQLEARDEPAEHEQATLR